MRALKTFLSLVLLASVVVFAPVQTEVAYAAAPPTTPITIKSSGFESGQTAATWGVNPTPPGYAPDAWWGRISFDKRSGTYSLWCGGYPDPYNWYAAYPAETSGRVTISAPELADYYSAKVSFWYKMPSRGAADDGSFLIAWNADANPGAYDSFPYFPLASVWTQKTFDLTSVDNDVNLSRQAGTVILEFNDKTGGSESPSEGKGASIDDIAITGYKYGPPRNFAATRQLTTQVLTWDTPYRAVGSTTSDARALTYRVWRAPGTTAPFTWTELPGDNVRLSANTYTDTTAVAGQTYTYLVQAWDTGTGTGYGEPATITATLPVTPEITLSASVDKPIVRAGTSVTWTYSAKNTGSATLTGVSIVDDWELESVATSASLAPGATLPGTRTRTINADTANSITASGTYGATTVTSTKSVPVDVIAPALSVDIQTATTTIAQGGTVELTYVVENTGDTALTGVSVSDSVLGSIASGLSLGVGEQRQFTADATFSATRTHTATAGGVDALIGSAVSNTDSVTVTVTHPGLTVTKTGDASAGAAGTTVHYTYRVENSGDVPLHDITLTDDKIPGTLGPVPDLAPGAFAEFTASDSLSIDTLNTATATGFYGTQGTAYYGSVSGSDTWFVDIDAPQILVAISPSKRYVKSGTVVTYTYTVTNNGSAPLTNVDVTDTVLGVVAADLSLAVGASQQFTKNETVTSDRTRTVNASGDFGATTVTSQASCVIDVIAPALNVTVVPDSTLATQGQDVTYTYTVDNTGDVTVNDITVSDNVYGALGTITSLAPADAPRVFTRTRAAGASDIEMTATGAGTDALGGYATSDTGSTSVDVRSPSISLDKAVSSDTVAEGEEIEITYTVTNIGDTALSGVRITDGEAGVDHEVGTLAKGAVATHTITHAVYAHMVGTAGVSATFGTASTPFYGTVAAQDTAPVTVVWPRIEVTASSSVSSVLEGGSVTFTYDVTNSGDIPLSGVTVTDAFGSVTAAFGLAAGETRTLTRTRTLTEPVDNTVTASGEYGGPAPVTASASVSVAVEPPRVAGPDRLSTAIEISQQLFPEPFGPDSRKAVVIATAFDFPDALSSSALAGALQGPLLLVQRDSLPAAVTAEIARLGAQKAYIVGGTGAVSESVANALSGQGLVVERVAGASRYGTAVAVAKTVKGITGTTSTVFLATGANFPDALAASSLAARMRAPILLSQRDALTADTDAYLKELRPARVIVCGGVGVISQAIEGSIAGAAYGSPEVTRNGGVTRYDTAAALIGWGVDDGLAGEGLDGMYLATGANYPDALAGGVLGGAGAAWRPLMLTDPATLSPQVAGLVSENPTIGFLTMLGGTGAVSDAVAEAARQLLQ